MAQATNTALGEIRLAGDLGGNNNALAPALSTTGVTAGEYVFPTFTVDAKGRITAASNGTGSQVLALLPDATSSTKGVASYGTGFSVSGGHVTLDVSALPTATPSVLGLVRAGGVGTNITNTAGVLSVPDATPSVRGVASFGTGFTVTSGVVTPNYATIVSGLPAATDSQPGLIRSGGAGTNIVNTAGTLSIPDATASVKGVASFSGTDFQVTSGAVSAVSTIPRTNAANVWATTQRVSLSALTAGATVTPNFGLSNIFTLTPNQNFTLANPTGVVAGTTTIIIVTQGSSPWQITFGSNFRFPENAVRQLSPANGSITIISIVALSSTVLLTTLQTGF